MNKEYLKTLVAEANKIDSQNEVAMEINRRKRLAEMTESLDDTISYLDICNENELLWATEVLEDLMSQFKSKKLIDCIKRNMERCVDSEIKAQLNTTIEYMLKYL